MRERPVGNRVLSRALVDARLRDVDVAATLGVDPKTVQRWLAGRIPQPQHRWALSDLLGRHEYELWPDLTGGPPIGPEVVATFPHRSAVPRDLWRSLIEGATSEIGILVYSGLFLAEDVDLVSMIGRRAADGVAVRILLGDPDSQQVALRGHEERIDEAMAGRIRHAIVLLEPLAVPGVEIRLHGTSLYNSIFRFDDDVLVNHHVYGVAAAHSPVLHLRHAGPSGLPATYLESFERVWGLGRELRSQVATT